MTLYEIKESCMMGNPGSSVSQARHKSGEILQLLKTQRIELFINC